LTACLPTAGAFTIGVEANPEGFGNGTVGSVGATKGEDVALAQLGRGGEEAAVLGEILACRTACGTKTDCSVKPAHSTTSIVIKVRAIKGQRSPKARISFIPLFPILAEGAAPQSSPKHRILENKFCTK
jgi:hypothetical protein